MTHSKTIKRPDGVEWRIEVYCMVSRWDVEISFFNTKDKCWHYPRGKNNHPLTPEEIHAAKMELWEKMKP